MTFRPSRVPLEWKFYVHKIQILCMLKKRKFCIQKLNFCTQKCKLALKTGDGALNRLPRILCMLCSENGKSALKMKVLQREEKKFSKMEILPSEYGNSSHTMESRLFHKFSCLIRQFCTTPLKSQFLSTSAIAGSQNSGGTVKYRES